MVAGASKKKKKFDLSIARDPRVREAIISLQMNEGWMWMKQVLDEQVKLLDVQIVEKIGLDNKPLTDQEVDILRERRQIYREVSLKPEQTIESMARFDPPAANDDPYDTTETLRSTRTPI